MKFYINALKFSTALSSDIKELIPQMNMRRRMNEIVRISVATAMESLNALDCNIDAIITASSLGCISDSEVFLKDLIESKEELLNPKAFIQSTVNIVSAQIALLKDLTCYNNTFMNSENAFGNCLIDAIGRLKNGQSKFVLIGLFDEFTDIVMLAKEKLNKKNIKSKGEYAAFFVLSKSQTNATFAEIESFKFMDKSELKQGGSSLILSKNIEESCITNMLELIAIAPKNRFVEIIDDSDEKLTFSLKLKCI